MDDVPFGAKMIGNMGFPIGVTYTCFFDLKGK